MKNINQSLKKCPYSLLALWLISILWAYNTQAKPKLFSNGAIAYAYPVNGITIDGNLDDWTANKLRKFPIKKVPFGKPAKNEADLSAYFYAGYNLATQSLYIVTVVTDESHVALNKKGVSWNEQDAYVLYLDSQHSTKGSGVLVYALNQFNKRLSDPSESWDPSIWNATMDNVTFAFKREGNNSVYECQIKLGDQLQVGKTFGLDHIVVDRDKAESGTSYLAWGSGGSKSQAPGRLGDLMIVKPKTTTGTIQGKIAWKDKDAKGLPGHIRVTSANNPAMWTEARVNKQGEFSFELPVGKYKMGLAWEFYTGEGKNYKIAPLTQKVTVKTDQVTQMPLIKLGVLPKIDKIPSKGILPNFTAKKAKKLDKFIAAYQDYYKIPGVSLVLIEKGKIIYHKTYGVKNNLSGAKVTDETLFEAASITKTVFGFLVCRLAEQGIIDLDKPLHQYLPFKAIAHDKRYELITARHVLSHRTGFPNWAYNNADGKLDIKFTPGTKFGYSGEGFEYLKRVVVKITGKDINTLLRKEVLEPLNLKNTYFMKDERLAKTVSNGHYGVYTSKISMPNAPGMAWSMFTEAKSFAEFALALRNRKGLKPETYDKMFKINTNVVREAPYARPNVKEFYGLSIWMEKGAMGEAFGHGGNNGDFQCQFKMYKDLDVGFVVFTNSDKGTQLNIALDQFLVTGKIKDHKE
ncbi:MAG TPA: hypothetical protein DCS93_38340 [Microscillaceae bacterium]|nr:hypothetical protein [Microscillaceae bacterium]